MLASIPGFTDRHGETNFRRLPRELLPIDTLQLDRASPLQHALLELIRHAEVPPTARACVMVLCC